MAMPEPPVKPPRGVKYAKETSGLLMSVIRTLSASESNEQRDREKGKLEREYKKSDQRLDELVSLHDQDLTRVMQLFGKLSTRVQLSREKIHAVKENLHACKMLLRCRREELKKLWLEGVEHKHVLELLEQIDQLREVPSKLEMHLSKKHYLHATRLLVSALSMGEGDLEGVEALREVRMELQSKKEILHTKLTEELSQQLYTHRKLQENIPLRRQGSGRDNLLSGSLSPFQRGSELRASTKSSRHLLDPGTNISQGSRASPGPMQLKNEDLMNIKEDTDLEDPEASSEHFMAILVECLALLHKLPDAIEAVKTNMQSELLAVLSRVTQQVQDHSSSNAPLQLPTSNIPVLTSVPSTGPAFLLELFSSVFVQLRCITTAHASLLHIFSCIAEKHHVDVHLYEMADVWSKIQAVLQLLLTDYLDIQNTSGEPQQAPSFSESASDMSVFFTRKKPSRQKKSPLFKFDYSSHALTMNSYLKDQWKSDRVMKDYEDPVHPKKPKQLVCQPDPQNIIYIFIPLMKFIEETEKEIGCISTSHCTLKAFLADYVKEVFLGRHHVTVAGKIEFATKAPDAWRAMTNPDTVKNLRLPRPLLQSTVIVEQCVQELRGLMQSLPVYSEHFLAIICNIVRGYRETCQAAYRGIVQPDSEDKRICSAAWLRDEDISRFIKSLPNWVDLQASKKESTIGAVTVEEESPEEVRQRNMREAEILASNLGEGGISRYEILSDVGQLRRLAHLQESMEWFSSSVMSFAEELLHSSSVSNHSATTLDQLPPLPESSVQCLLQLAKEFEELANTCLLVLHLEVRVQCFHYLLPQADTFNRFAGGGMDSQEPDPQVFKLSQVLINIDEAMTSSLQPRKIKYIFEGLGHLIAKILISSAQYIRQIDEGGIRKMCRNIFALQQTLTNITMAREIALDHARHYFELFYLTPEEILSRVMEKGQSFSELEYMNAFQLIHRSQSDSDYGAVNLHLKRLSDILGEVSVTV
ncbi:exocyst complex component 4 isoform X1 [Schistocerca cancellata]|uniref:exocyst complex component 4 isoform X1 n=2 Tax=Schistocerca cancellata TaxID=274614 RepID=UPI002117AA87|nr:exocyst complex component 4 isoform X1 [Schistocerca cancellata]